MSRHLIRHTYNLRERLVVFSAFSFRCLLSMYSNLCILNNFWIVLFDFLKQFDNSVFHLEREIRKTWKGYLFPTCTFRTRCNLIKLSRLMKFSWCLKTLGDNYNICYYLIITLYQGIVIYNTIDNIITCSRWYFYFAFSLICHDSLIYTYF